MGRRSQGASLEESPGFTEQDAGFNASGGDPKESATENKPQSDL